MATIRQKKAAKLLTEKSRSVSSVMREVGYAAITATRPKTLTESKGFKELMDEIIPDRFLTKKHKELLEVPIKIVTTKHGEFVDEETSLDVQAISKGLDMAYKIKGHYAPEKKELTGAEGKDLFPDDDKELNDYAQWRKQRLLSSAVVESAEEKPPDLDSGQQNGE